MLLVFDVGNTHIVVGVYEGQSLLDAWRIHTCNKRTSDEYQILLQQLLRGKSIGYEHIKGVCISSVVPPVLISLITFVEDYLNLTPLVVGSDTAGELNILYESPHELGADRIANAVAASQMYPAPIIVVDFGTATTLCFIDEEKNYVGGVIAPGIRTSAQALHERSAKLVEVEIKKPYSVVGRSTRECVQSGLYYGYIGLVDGLIHRMSQGLTEKPHVIATGGLASYLSNDSRYIQYVNPNLTLEGIRLIYEHSVLRNLKD